ncbi:hypothetical protein [Treponema zioleckii]|uniref:hypothetical protein n=1 Tax=Treponema zioleckii TaxID=331680 RepID=UPI00168BE9B1|nr:hypothetical protein [Treponema zioleckii]
MKLRSVIFGGIVTLALSLLASCSDVAESGSATFKIDTSKLLSRAVSLADDTTEEESGTVDIEVYADVFCTSGSSSFKRKATILTESYSIEEYKNIQNENEGKASEALKSFTVDDLPVGKTVSFKVKIYSKSTTTYSATGNSEPVEEIIAISTNEPSAKIGADTEVEIKVGDYDISLDWEVVKFTVTGDAMEVFQSETLAPPCRLILWKKTGDSYTRVAEEAEYDNIDTTSIKISTDGNFIFTATGYSTDINVGDTIYPTLVVTTDNQNIYHAWGSDVKITSEGTVFDVGSLTKNTDATLTPAPKTMWAITLLFPDAETDKYCTIEIKKAAGTEAETIESLTQEIFVPAGSTYTTVTLTPDISSSDTTSYLLSAQAYSDQEKTHQIYATDDTNGSSTISYLEKYLSSAELTLQ